MATFNGNDNPNGWGGTWEGDLFIGRGGNDLAYAWTGNDTFFGGTGHDTLFGQDGDDLGFGGEGNDRLDGGGGLDTLRGQEGDDWLSLGSFSGSAGEAYGGSGADVLQVLSPSSAVTLDGGIGVDQASLFYTDQTPTGDIVIDFSGPAFASSDLGGALTLVSIERLHAYIAASGHHQVTGSGLVDSVTLTEAAGASVIDLGAGRDWASVHAGAGHVLEGGAGHDRLRLTSYGAMTLVVDDLTGTASTGNDTITGFESYETVIYGRADVTFGAGNDVLYGGVADDLAHGGAGRDRLIGRGGFDLLYGGEGDDNLAGGFGSDQLYGDAGNDLLIGGRGSDSVFGGDGDDELRGGWDGVAELWGGAGADRFVFKDFGLVPHVIKDFTSGTDSLQFDRYLVEPGEITLQAGALDPSRLSLGAPSGSLGQFVLSLETPDMNALLWDADGEGLNFTGRVMLRFDGSVTLTAADIFLL